MFWWGFFTAFGIVSLVALMVIGMVIWHYEHEPNAPHMEGKQWSI